MIAKWTQWICKDLCTRPILHLTICIGDIFTSATHTEMAASLWVKLWCAPPDAHCQCPSVHLQQGCTWANDDARQGGPDFMRPSLCPVDPPWDYILIIIMHWCAVLCMPIDGREGGCVLTGGQQSPPLLQRNLYCNETCNATKPVMLRNL